MSNNKMPARNCVSFSIHRFEFCLSIQERRYILHNMPFRMTAAAFLNVARICIEPERTESCTFDLGFFASYQYVDMFFVHFRVRVRLRARCFFVRNNCVKRCFRS